MFIYKYLGFNNNNKLIDTDKVYVKHTETILDQISKVGQTK